MWRTPTGNEGWLRHPRRSTTREETARDTASVPGATRERPDGCRSGRTRRGRGTGRALAGMRARPSRRRRPRGGQAARPDRRVPRDRRPRPQPRDARAGRRRRGGTFDRCPDDRRAVPPGRKDGGPHTAGHRRQSLPLLADPAPDRHRAYPDSEAPFARGEGRPRGGVRRLRTER